MGPNPSCTHGPYYLRLSCIVLSKYSGSAQWSAAAKPSLFGKAS